MPPCRLRKVLVANRGEIALRVIRACRTRGLATVAIYSDVDRTALHVRAADEAYRVGAAPAPDSYLNTGAIIGAARASGCDAVHPGYGFLAENPEFAASCAGAGLVFIGPPVAVLALCGDKAETRRAVRAAGVPVLPGTDPVDDEAAGAAARRTGFPLLIKAAAGGGGKGIHLVRRAEDLVAALRLARGEAQSAFGDSRVYLEKWIDEPRHVEVQIAADAHGGVVHLGERECSIQRRHQKIIEEAPSPGVTAALRTRVSEAAVAAARAVGYQNAGTVEFLVSGTDFYFLEINARLQVEHPVTECVTGVDLVEWQLVLAAGERVPQRQRDVALRGHAIECRISAEDTEADFLPWTGRVGEVLLPGGPGIRVDGALAPGMDVTRFYDPLLAKVIAWGDSRDEAITRMAAALREMVVTGIPTTIPFHLWALRHPAFRAGTYNTRFVESEWPRRERTAVSLAALAAAVLTHKAQSRVPFLPPQDAGGWARAARWDAASGGLPDPWDRSRRAR
jgi:acetyl-CoA carboxylase biotin carboxylase subunit